MDSTEGGTVTGKANIAARAGRWSALHRKTAIFGWLAFVLVAFALGSSLGTEQVGAGEGGVGESGRADRVLHEEFRQPAGERVLVQAKSPRAAAAGARDVRSRLSNHREVTSIRRPVLSDDGRSALVQFQLRGDPERAVERVGSVLAVTHAAQK